MSVRGFRDLYSRSGPTAYYLQHGDQYQNPHEPAVAAAVRYAAIHWSFKIDFSHVLDLAAGSGEVTVALNDLLPEARIEGIDPYTHRLYQQRTGRPCLAVTFEQLAKGEHELSTYRCIIVSCALHLVAASWLPSLCLRLSAAAPDLLVLTPITRPEIRPSWGWVLQSECLIEAEARSLRLRWYRSNLAR